MSRTLAAPEPSGPDLAGPDSSRRVPAVPGAVLPGDVDGPASSTEALWRFGRRYLAAGRTVVSVICAAVGPFAAPPEGVGFAALVATTVVVWNLVYLAMLLPDGHSRVRHVWTYALDLPVVCTLCLTQAMLVDPGLLSRSLGWVAPMVSFTVVGLQFQLRPLPAAAATAAICVAFVVGVAAAPGLTVWDGVLAGGGTLVVAAVLGRLLWQLLLQGGREADQLMQARFAAEREAATAAARRADQRAHWATVHDTAASTLLMIGMGEVTGTEGWLPDQVRRDIAMLDGRHEGGGEVDVGTSLRDVAALAHVRVELDCPTGVTAPSAVVAALTGAVTEALENVHRHAGSGTATLALHRRSDDGPVEIVVTDDGPGFDPQSVGPHRFGLAWSVHDRMGAVGGSAVVESAPGRGTVVRLRWPA